MIISIFALILFYYLSKFITNRIKEIKTNNKKENEQNFWMFTYDFKTEKKDSIFDNFRYFYEWLKTFKLQAKKE